MFAAARDPVEFMRAERVEEVMITSVGGGYEVVTYGPRPHARVF